MPAVSTLILRSMRLIGEKSRGGTLDSNEQTETLDEFNSFLETISIEKTLCFSVTQDSHLLTASTATYTIGPGATIDTARPVKIVDPCWTRDSDGYDYPLKVIPLETYGLLTDKSSGATIPTHLYYDAGFSATSTASLTLYPPPQTGLTLYIHSWKQFTTASTQSVNMLMPTGYRAFIESNFAIHLAAGQTPVSNELAKMARDTRAVVKRLNNPTLVMRLDKGSMSGSHLEHSIFIDSEYIE